MILVVLMFASSFVFSWVITIACACASVVGLRVTYDHRYACRQKLYLSKVHTNSGKQPLPCTATNPWDNIHTHLKDLNVLNVSK